MSIFDYDQSTFLTMDRLNKIRNLNGWQRLWLVLAILWLFTVPFLLMTGFPIEEKWNVEARLKSMEIKEAFERKRVVIDSGCQDRAKEFGVPADFGRCMTAHSYDFQNLKRREQEDQTLAYTEQRVRIEESLGNEQFKYLGLGALVWFLPVVALYLLGWAVGWIRKGFSARDRLR